MIHSSLVKEGISQEQLTLLTSIILGTHIKVTPIVRPCYEVILSEILIDNTEQTQSSRKQ